MPEPKIPAPDMGTCPLDERTAAMLRESERIVRCEESGWACATGYMNGCVHIAVHARSHSDIDAALAAADPT